MRLAPIVARLKEKGFKRVYGALEFAALKTAPGQLPAYFVIPQGWGASPNRSTGVHDQALSETFGVVMMLPGAARSEAAIADDLHDEEQRVIDALAGWTHPDASRACDVERGNLLSVDGHTLSWMVTVRTGRHIRKAVA